MNGVRWKHPTRRIRHAAWMVGQLFLVSGWLSSVVAVGWTQRKLTQTRAQVQRELAVMTTLVDSLPPPVLQVLEEVSQRRKVLAGAVAQQEESVWGGRASDEPTTPLGLAPSDVYFRLQVFGDTHRSLATAAGVKIGADDFGFSTYRERGPGPELLDDILHQKADLESLLRVVIEAHPAQIDAVQRLRPRAPTDEDALHVRASSGDVATDFFTPHPGSLLAVRGKGRTAAYRISGRGSLSMVRSLLFDLAKPGHPFWVREVELRRVERAGPTATSGEAEAITSGEPSSHPLEWALVVQVIDRTHAIGDGSTTS